LSTVTFVVDEHMALNAGNTLKVVTIGTKNLGYIPAQTGTTYNPALLTPLEDYYPDTLAGGGNTVAGHPDAILNFTQQSSAEFEYNYDLSASGTSFTYVVVSPGFFDDQGVFQGIPMDLSQNYVFAARGSNGGRVKIELVDVNHVKATYIILLSPVYQNYVLDLGGTNVPALFDKTQIAEIDFVQDRTIGSPLLNDIVKIQTQGLDYVSPPLPPAMAAIQSTLVTEGLGYFQAGAGIDPVTHFPYDNLTSATKYTQPTLIGFYLQILGDDVLGSLNNGMTKTQALAEIQTVLTNLLSVQSSYGWNGLIPWLNLGPLGLYEKKVALGDNANLAQSLAVMVGALESSGLSAANLTTAQQITVKVDQFLNAQAAGYAAFVDPGTGLFRGDYTWTTNPATGTFSNYIDRLATEFRGAIAFLKVRFPTLPSTVWDNLAIVTNSSYVDRNGQTITNLAAWDGGAFQTFWPSLRNDESDFVGFSNVLYNQLVTQLDYSYQNRIPGVLSAAQDPNGAYQPNTGIPQISEHDMSYENNIVMNLGSTYALASAMGIDVYAVLGWLDAIHYLYGMNGTYGFFDSARSASEIAPGYLGIDVASTVLGLSGNGGADFEIYLRNRSLEASYNTLYDQKSQLLSSITRTSTAMPVAPEFPDRSLAVFSHIASEGTINNFQAATTQPYGVRLIYTNLAGADSGHFWKFNQVYDAQANQLILQYSAVDSPQAIRIELKDASGVLLYQTTATLQQGAAFARLVIDLPNSTSLSNVKELALVVDPQEGGDATGDFTIHNISFQHVPSAPAVGFTAQPGSPAVTILPVNTASVGGVGQLASSSPSSTLTHTAGTNFFQLHFDLRNPNAYAGVVLNFDPSHNGSSIDLSAVPNLIFGINSATAKNLKITIKDTHGNTYSTSNTDIVASGYYKFLTSLAAGRVDLKHITSITFGVDQYSVTSGTEGDLRLEIGGLS
jgi:hypothetical protein